MFEWLQEWYDKKCDNKNVKYLQLSIGTLDNPGWLLEFNLKDTEFNNNKMERKVFEISDTNWHQFKIDENIWSCAGGAENLTDIIAEFRKFVEFDEENILGKEFNMLFVIWLQQWYKNECNGDWEHSYGVDVRTLNGICGWTVKIELIETAYENIIMEEIKKSNSNRDWYECWISDNIWYAKCGPPNLVEVLGKFKAFIDSHTDNNKQDGKK